MDAHASTHPPIYRPFSKVLVANRGEIALRVLRACRERGLATVAVYSDADADAPHVAAADEAVHIGPAASRESYLNPDALLQAAARTGADALHPGYGFLAEHAGFAAQCLQAGLVWIGPQPAAIDAMGSKTEARALAERLGVPVIPGWQGISDDISLGHEAEAIGYPLLLKAVAGGGGRGMRLVSESGAFAEALASARREARQAFGDERIYLEKYLPRVRHIEFQILGDSQGKLIHLGERECSLQRRYQKLIEEAPSPVLSPELRAEMGAAAVTLGQALSYCGAGTVEFVYDESSQGFYFLEVNTRLQVEHPVTELVTGIDLVHWQLRIAAGEPLSLNQAEIVTKGHAIECRICAEGPDFMPATGTVLVYQEAQGPGVRHDSGLSTGRAVPVDYDSMLGKLIVHAESRPAAIQKLRAALAGTVILGLQTNLDFLKQLVARPEFASADFHTRWIEEQLGELGPASLTSLQRHELALVAALWGWAAREGERGSWASLPSGWRNSPGALQRTVLRLGGSELEVAYQALPDRRFAVRIEDVHSKVRLIEADASGLCLDIDGLRRRYSIAAEQDQIWIHHPSLGTRLVEGPPRFPLPGAEASHGGYTSAMPAKVLQILVEPEADVEAGQPLLVLESMKMESTLCAAEAGTVEAILVSPGELVAAGTTLLAITPA